MGWAWVGLASLLLGSSGAGTGLAASTQDVAPTPAAVLAEAAQTYGYAQPADPFEQYKAYLIARARACLSPWAGLQPLMPVFSSGQWAGLAPDLYAALGAVDLMHLAGGGIIGHPDGIAAGMASMREGWEAAKANVPLKTYAESHPALKRALVHFSNLSEST
jgi:ribulose 1,5-bisphosphate carboxylase large subunit-like protein